MSAERELFPGSREYKNMKMAAMVGEMLSPNHWEYRVESTYLDYGQNWVWTTIIVYNHRDFGGSYQALNPREWNEIVDATEPEQIVTVMREHFKDKYCPDRKEKVKR